MTLDLSQVTPQIEAMAAQLKAEVAAREASLTLALDLMRRQSAQLAALKEKIARSRRTFTWLLAGLTDALAEAYQPSAPPSDFSVMATDGSQIALDRHAVTRCYLINIGSVALHYGSMPEAHLSSSPTLYFGTERLSSADIANRGQELPFSVVLPMRRAVAEAEGLADLVNAHGRHLPSLALMDGSLILWGLEGARNQGAIAQTILTQGLLPAFDRLREENQHQPLALASYISLPGSCDVVNTLRLALCPHPVANCDRYCAAISAPDRCPCDAVNDLFDRVLFQRHLRVGERSAVFASYSSVVPQYYGQHHIHFFYLRLEDEVTRVEVPAWVAQNPPLLELTHSLILDQCQRGNGYPVALSEAHERAVVSTADREQFWQLVESALTENRVPLSASGKGLSKRTRWV